MLNKYSNKFASNEYILNMKYNPDKIQSLLDVHTDIILKNGPLEELAADARNGFQRLMDAVLTIGPRDRRPGNWNRFLDVLLQQYPDKARFKQEGRNYVILMSNTEWRPRARAAQASCVLKLTVPSRGWEYDFLTFSEFNITNLFAIDEHMPLIVAQADKLCLLARIVLASREHQTDHAQP